MSSAAIETPHARGVDMKLEVVVIPVSDVDRAKAFYERIWWRLNLDRSAKWPEWYAAYMVAEQSGNALPQ
jgi:hypothetical protein